MKSTVPLGSLCTGVASSLPVRQSLGPAEGFASPTCPHPKFAWGSCWQYVAKVFRPDDFCKRGIRNLMHCRNIDCKLFVVNMLQAYCELDFCATTRDCGRLIATLGMVILVGLMAVACASVQLKPSADCPQEPSHRTWQFGWGRLGEANAFMARL
jgi:hypothetical protein